MTAFCSIAYIIIQGSLKTATACQAWYFSKKFRFAAYNPVTLQSCPDKLLANINTLFWDQTYNSWSNALKNVVKYDKYWYPNLMWNKKQCEHFFSVARSYLAWKCGIDLSLFVCLGFNVAFKHETFVIFTFFAEEKQFPHCTTVDRLTLSKTISVLCFALNSPVKAYAKIKCHKVLI